MISVHNPYSPGCVDHTAWRYRSYWHNSVFMYYSRKFGRLILTKIIKIVATRCCILRPKSIEFDFGWGSAPDPTEGAYSAPPDPLAGGEGGLLPPPEGLPKNPIPRCWPFRPQHRCSHHFYFPTLACLEDGSMGIGFADWPLKLTTV